MSRLLATDSRVIHTNKGWLCGKIRRAATSLRVLNMYERIMRHLLQRASDGYYYSGPGRWTVDEQAACNFSQTIDAINSSIKEHHRPLHLVLKSDDDSFGVSLPLMLSEN